MIARELAHALDEALDDTPAVALLGPRQVGKTTLAFAATDRYDSIYLDLENPEDAQKLANANHYFDLHQDQLIILDEVQRMPGLFKLLRGNIDKGRREGKANGRFLLLGSASNQLLRQSAESLAGRVQYLELQGFLVSEIYRNEKNAIQKLWLRGGFPNSFLAKSEKRSVAWRNSFIRTYVERDIPQLGANIPAETLMRFWTMLAHYQGELLNASKLASALGVESVTVSRYLDMMTDLMLIRKLQPWHGNVKKRLVKSPRTYVRDSGVLHTLLRISNYEDLLGNPIYGKSWEGFVIEQIIGALPQSVRYYFYRTAAGAEIDLLLEYAPFKYWAIEIKSSHTPKLSKGFYIACQDLNITEQFVIYLGTDTFLMDTGVQVMSLGTFVLEQLPKITT